MSDPKAKKKLSVAELDDVVHQRTRLGVMALLHQTGEADFGTIRGLLELTAGNLSRHLRVLSLIHI